jgi:hypothetical protein
MKQPAKPTKSLWGFNIRIISARNAPIDESGSLTKKRPNKTNQNGMREDYNFSHAQRGRYTRRYSEGTNVVVLEPDVAKVFSNSKKVNASLRKLIRAESSAA